MSQRGRGVGRGGGRGAGGRRPAQSSPDQPTPMPAQRGGRTTRGSSSSSTVAPASATPVAFSSATVSEGASSSGASVAALSRDVEHRLKLQAPMPSPSPSQQPPPASSKAARFPARPGPGTLGTKCMVRANHFLVKLQDKDLHHYDVAITPEVKSRGVNRAIMHQLVSEHGREHLGNRQPAYDGRKSLYTAGALPFDSQEFVVKLVSDDGDSSRRKERSFKVAIKLAARADMHHLQQFLCGRQIDSPQDTIQALDVVLRQSPSENCTIVGRSFFSVQFGHRADIGDGLECWKGFYQSLRPTQMGLSLNIDVSATSFYEPVNVVEFVFKYLNIRDPSRPFSDTDRVKLKKALRGVKVEVTHRKDKRRYKISGVTPQATNQLRFPDENGKMKSVVHYFQEKYGIRLQYVSFPSLQAGSDSRPVYLPMEVCQIVPGQRYTKKLNERQVTALLRAACQRPREREDNIKAIVARNQYKNDKLAREFGVAVDDKLMCIEDARVLPPPVLKYHDTGREVRVSPRVGQWNMINTKMVNGARVDHWACINFSSRLNSDAAWYFFNELVGMCANKGMVFNPNPLLPPMLAARSSNIEQTLEEVSKQSASKLASMGVKAQLQLVIIILPESTSPYATIKRLCETKLGIITQCCQPRNAMKVNKQYLENVALKINVKTGGRNTVLLDAVMKRIPLVSDAPTIIFGADVTHPQPGEDSSPSIAAVVASMDWPEVTKYRGLVSAQPRRMELIQDLYKVVQDPQRGNINSGIIRELLIAFRRSTGYKPHRIIFYRDGVSEGQFSQVLLYELDAIRKACASLEEGYLPPVTFVVVQKRHHTRLFPADHNNKNLTDRSGNILPGTVVDTKICHPLEFDFYLCSHSGIQGTSRPTHYHVLWDENRFTSDTLQTLTNNLCYTYARCTRSVSIVPPAYYAHLAAFRARYYMEGDTSDSGSGVGSSRGAGVSAQPKVLPQVMDNVKEVMFYC